MKRNRLLTAFSNDQLIRKGDRAVRSRHDLAIEILDCLIEIERRSLHLEEGYSSLFDYCTRHWHYSPPKACRTIAVARCVKKFPQVRTLLVEQKITLCGVAKIAGILTDENSRNLLREVSGKNYAEIEKIVASMKHAPRIREFVRPIGVVAMPNRESKAGDNDLFQVTKEAAAEMAGRTANHTQIEGKWQTDQPTRGVIDTDTRTASIEEKTESRYEIRFSVSDRFLRKLNRAKAICSRRPGLEAVIEKALDELLERHAPERKEARREKRKSVQRDQSEPVQARRWTLHICRKERCSMRGNRSPADRPYPAVLPGREAHDRKSPPFMRQTQPAGGPEAVALARISHQLTAAVPGSWFATTPFH